MDPQDRFTALYRMYEPDMHPKEYYMKKLLDGLFERSIVSNTPRPTLLPSFDDIADMANIIDAMETLIEDFKQEIQKLDHS